MSELITNKLTPVDGGTGPLSQISVMEIGA